MGSLGHTPQSYQGKPRDCMPLLVYNQTDMAKKKNADQEPADNILVDAAKTIGTAAGKVAAALGAAPDAPPQISKKIPKLAKRNKARLPRREKKAQKKAASKQ